ncbi:MAG TPA: CPBP family intramembrane metalloprotease [Leptolyngbyaceae cyanobacterium M33_DOE_097]|uniref:CPBP family intramembrane metalloprotease n=1 Tax=Oscillatoriales cyanobacterium SpSt-418 TaxID=2282169 RepID=A0A7C3KGD8_9CYAN|nr:CPBP family intramembrane metalloprotease [Leptolyngbyaceae cyanobacterium M33_DOE_097]
MSVRLFTVLWLVGLMGIISLWWMELPIPPDHALQVPLWALKLLSLIQPTLLLTIAVWLGVALAHRVGLSAPVAEAIARGISLKLAMQPQVVPGMVGGLVGGVLLLAIQLGARFVLPPDFVAKAEALAGNTSFATRILYGGVTEELLLRWGVMTLLVWLGWRIFAKGHGKPTPSYFVAAIALSSLLFGLGHLPLAFSLGTSVTASVIVYVVIANAVFGFIAGYLYWHKGLESAMLAHMLVHVVLVTAGLFAR